MNVTNRSLNAPNTSSTNFSAYQNRTVLIAGLTCACFSVLATLLTLRWFILMKRSFRHTLIMFLIFSDTFKAFWYFIFPIVVFTRGPVLASSAFCQATGFFLAVGIEASDFAILMIALHSILYIFFPPARSGDSGGLYRWRKYVYPAWIGLPLLAASLAFVNPDGGYTTAGTFCYLPRRPFWYRLALSWIPRYFIFMIIFAMYTAVYVYVALKFRSFGSLQDSDSHVSSTAYSRRSSLSDDEIASDEPARPVSGVTSPRKSKIMRPTFSRAGSHSAEPSQPAHEANPWDEVSFITTGGLRHSGAWQPGVQSSDFAFGSRDLSVPNATTSSQSRLDVGPMESRKGSHAPTTNSHISQLTGTTSTTNHQEGSPELLSQTAHKHATTPTHIKPQDPLKRTRRAIRKQLRYLFIYPALYLIMWIFPFASHCLNYSDYYVQNPVYWLTIVSTCMFSLQAGADCVVFSWRERPWRRIADDSKFSLHVLRPSYSIHHDSGRDRSAMTSIAIAPDEERGIMDSPPPSNTLGRNTSNNWWEAEGRKRKDSVWLGTDTYGTAAIDDEEIEVQQNGASIPRTITEEHESPVQTSHSFEIFRSGDADRTVDAAR